MLGVTRHLWRVEKIEMRSSGPRIKKAGLRTIAEALPVHRLGLGALPLSIDDHESLSASTRPLGKNKVATIVDPARLNTMRSALGKNTALAGAKVKETDLKATAHSSSKCNFGRIARIPRCLGTMRADVCRNFGQGSRGKLDFIQLRFPPSV